MQPWQTRNKGSAFSAFAGSNGNLLEELPENCEVLQIKNPILTSVELLKIKYMENPGFRVETISLLYYKSTPLENAVEPSPRTMPSRKRRRYSAWTRDSFPLPLRS